MSRSFVLAAALAVVAAIPLNAVAAPSRKPGGDVVPFQATETTLPNGLKVIVVPTGFPNLVSLRIPVQTGSRNEIEPGKSGFAHFFEHVMFRGTKNYPPERFERVMVESGAKSNASTSDDVTTYYVTFAKEDLDQMLSMYADMFQNLDYPEEAFKTESRAVLGEYNKNSASPFLKINEVQRDHAFTTHTYKHTTMGFLKDIEDMPNQFAYSKVFFDRWYRPEYTTIIVAGDVDAKTVLPMIEKHWGAWKHGTYKIDIPQEPAARGPVYAHVPWTTPTSPYVTVGFHAPAFSTKGKDAMAMFGMSSVFFGETSDLYRKLLIQEQRVDQLFASAPARRDPQLFTVYARLKRAEDATYVRDEILKAFARAAKDPLPAQRLADAKANARYGFVRALDNTDQIAAVLGQYVHFERAYGTVNDAFRVFDSLTPADIQATAKKYFTDANLVVTTLSKDDLPAAIRTQPKLGDLMAALPPLEKAPAKAKKADAASGAATAAVLAASTGAASGSKGATHGAPDIPVLVQRTPLPQLNLKLVFNAGSAYDPPGKEGLAALAASMVADAGSRAMTYEEINAAFYPMAASFTAQVDKEMATFTANVHQDNWRPFLDVALPMLLDPGFRADDFQRLKDQQLNGLRQDLIANNEEELGKERLQAVVFAGTPYAHPPVGTFAGIGAITIDDVKGYVREQFTRGNLQVAVNGDAPPEMLAALEARLNTLPVGAAPAPRAVAGRRAKGLEIDIVKKDTRATAISFGLPIEVTRSHPDFAALSVVRSFLGEHRASQAHLYQRIREVRGMNYGDYAYIEAFPGGMFTMLPNPNVARRAQLFEVWIRPVVPANGPMALKIALHELRGTIDRGLTAEQFESTRNYLMKNVYILTQNQDQQVGYALDSKFYGTDEFTKHMRERLAKLTLGEVNAAMRKHLSGSDLSVVMITKDAEALRDQLVADAPSKIAYDAPKPEALLAEDRAIGAMKLGLTADRVRITPVEEIFAR